MEIELENKADGVTMQSYFKSFNYNFNSGYYDKAPNGNSDAGFGVRLLFMTSSTRFFYSSNPNFKPFFPNLPVKQTINVPILQVK